MRIDEETSKKANFMLNQLNELTDKLRKDSFKAIPFYLIEKWYKLYYSDDIDCPIDRPFVGYVKYQSCGKIDLSSNEEIEINEKFGRVIAILKNGIVNLFATDIDDGFNEWFGVRAYPIYAFEYGDIQLFDNPNDEFSDYYKIKKIIEEELTDYLNKK